MNGPLHRFASIFWSSRSGELLATGSAVRRRFVIDPRSGTLLASVDRSVVLDAQAVLCLPEDCQDALQLMVDVAEADEKHSGHLMDRFTAYHGRPEPGLWALLTIQAAKQSGDVLEAADLPLTNPLADAEPRLIRQLNTDKSLLRHAAERHLASIRVDADVLAVGFDPRGIDLRTREGLVRLGFTEPATDVPAAESRLAALLHHP